MHKRFVPALFLLLASWLAAAAGFAQDPWPSLRAQLAHDKVPAGSALAKLIAENQDFQLLRPEEARDSLGLPLWLRVVWRKQHPEGDYSADDPMGGYPLALKDIHEWMIEHPDLQPGKPEPDVPLPAETKAASAGPDHRIGGLQPTSRAESDIRVNYWDPSQVIASANNLGGSGQMAMYYSRDGGATWGNVALPRVEDDSFHSDPTVDWTSDGTAWTTVIGISSAFDLKLRAYRSADGGATWQFDDTLSGAQTIADKQMIWTDHSARSPHKDNLYAIWHNGRPIYMNRRTGPGGAWGNPIQVSGTETGGTGLGADVKSNASGQVFGFWHDTGSRKIFTVRSTNGGASYTKPSTVATTFAGEAVSIPAQARRTVLIYVTAGAFQSGKKSFAYAAWTDLTGAPGCRTPFDNPRTSLDSSCKSRIWFSRSTNGGVKWAKPRMLNDGPARNDQFHPWLVVDEATGALGIIYYDTVGEQRTAVNVWYQSSFDQGVRWSAPLKLTSAPSDATTDGSSGFQFGDYNGLSGIAGTFLPSWTDRRVFFDEIWTVEIRDTKALICTAPELFEAEEANICSPR
jgi:hypothetical protein